MKDSWKEILFQKEWLELQAKLHWDNFRVNTDCDKENSKLWAKIRKDGK